MDKNPDSRPNIVKLLDDYRDCIRRLRVDASVRVKLLNATKLGDFESVVDMLDNYEQDLKNSEDDKTMNALHCAANSSNASFDLMVTLIEDFGFDPQERGFHGRNALLLACESGKNNLEKVKYLVNNYPELVGTIDNWKNTALHLAARLGNLETTEYLVGTGKFDVATENFEGHSVIEFARIGENSEGNPTKDLKKKLKLLKVE